MNYQNQKYLHISQHWGSLKGMLKNGKTEYSNPIRDLGKNKINHLKDLELLIEFHNWSDNGIYYKFSEEKEASWGQEVYEIKSDGSLEFVGADYDTSD
jgi:hypothetical protein